MPKKTRLTRIGMIWPCFFIVIGMSTASFNRVFGQDSIETVREAFSTGKYSWYHEETDSVGAIDSGKMRPAASAHRSQVPLRELKTVPTPKQAPRFPTSTTSQSEGLPGWIPTASVWLLVAAGLAGLGALLLWAFFKRESSFDGDGLDPDIEDRTDADRIRDLPFEIAKLGFEKTGDLSDRAREALSQGNGRLAAVLLYGQVLVALDKNGLIRLRKGKTNRNYLSEVVTIVPIAEYFQAVMIPFERAFFGNHKVPTATVETCISRYEKFLSDVEKESKAKFS